MVCHRRGTANDDGLGYEDPLRVVDSRVFTPFSRFQATSPMGADGRRN